MTAWNDFVKKIYHEGHKKDPSYQFKNALQDASKRKSEMGTSTAAPTKSKKSKRRMTKSKKGGKRKRTRKNRKH